MNSDHQFLMSLLNDEDEYSASLAMSALLEETDHSLLEEDLCKLQETSDPRLRKRIHQLQSTMALRRRRPAFAEFLRSEKKPDLLDGLMRIHLLWFDNDSGDVLKKGWDKFVASAGKYAPDTLEEIALFMRKKKFHCVHKDELEPENFCFGSVLSDKLGADFMLCALAKELFRNWNRNPQYGIHITQAAEKDFILVDSEGNIAVPANDWDYIPFEQQYRFEFWDNRALLKYAAMLLFLCASSTDSFRYVHTVGACLSDTPDDFDPVSALPYPYGKR